MSCTRLNPKVGSQLYVNGVTATIAAGSSSVDITAPAVQGYTFLCWLDVGTEGWIGNAYIANNSTSSTKVWSNRVGVINGSPAVVNGSLNVRAFALYTKS